MLKTQYTLAGIVKLPRDAANWTPVSTQNPQYRGYRFPPEIISYAVWLCHRFCLSFRDVEELLAERGVTVSYEAVRQWCLKFGQAFARKLRHRQGRLGDTWYMDEVFVSLEASGTICGVQWIKTVTYFIFSFSNGAISVRLNGSFANC